MTSGTVQLQREAGLLLLPLSLLVSCTTVRVLSACTMTTCQQLQFLSLGKEICHHIYPLKVTFNAVASTKEVHAILLLHLDKY